MFFFPYVQHALPLPGFLLLSKDIYRHIFVFNSSGKYEHIDIVGWWVRGGGGGDFASISCVLFTRF